MPIDQKLPNLGQRRIEAEAELARLKALNATRKPCPYCDVLCLPENLERHISFHED